MVFGFIINNACILLGTSYPIFQSFRAIRSEDSTRKLKWSKYWIVFAAYLVLSTFGDILLLSYIIPFYDLLRFAAVFYIVCPWTNGSDFVYDKFVAPFLENHEEDFDRIMETLSLYLHSTFVNALTGFLGRTVGRLCFRSPNFRAAYHGKQCRPSTKTDCVEEEIAGLPQLRFESVQKTNSSTVLADNDSPDGFFMAAENCVVVEDVVSHRKSEEKTVDCSEVSAAQVGVRRTRRKRKSKEVQNEGAEKRSLSRSRTRATKKTTRKNTKASM